MGKKTRVHRTSRSEYLQSLIHEYMKVHNVHQYDLNEVFDWAWARGEFRETPIDRKKYFVGQLRRASRDDRWIDPQHRDVRRMYPAPYPTPDGQMQWIWAELTHATPAHMKVSLAMRRDNIRDIVRQHQMTVESYNDNNVHGAKLDLFDYDFNKDAAEMNMPETWSEDEEDQEEEENEDQES